MWQTTVRRICAVTALGFAAFFVAMTGHAAHGMELATHGNTIILLGPVAGTELAMLKNAFAANPKIDLVVLRNSHGGDAWTGYRVGELLREAG